MKAIYVGAGLDISPIEILQNDINEYYFIDSLPYSEKGKDTFILPNGTNAFYRPFFLLELKKKFINNNFILIEENENEFIFKKKDIIINYLYNTSIPEDLDKIQNKIMNYKYLIINNFIPDINIVYYTDKLITIYGFINTHYFNINKDIKDNNEKINSTKNQLHLYLHQGNKKIKYKNKTKYTRELFDTYNMININHEIITFNNWKEFYKYYYCNYYNIKQYNNITQYIILEWYRCEV